MTDTPTAQPTKREVIRDLLHEVPVIIVHLDPRHEGVVLPRHLVQESTVALSLGLDLPVPIPDLDLGEDAITATLSFSRTPHRCVLPWSAIYLVTTDSGRAFLWAQDAPPDALADLLALALAEREAAERSGAPARPEAAPPPTRRRARAKPRPRPVLQAVDGGRTDPGPPPGDGAPRPTLRLVR